MRRLASTAEDKPGAEWPDEKGGVARGRAEGSGPAAGSGSTADGGEGRTEALGDPGRARIRGPGGVIPREGPGMTCAVVDIRLPEGRKRGEGLDDLAARVLEDLLAAAVNDAVRKVESSNKEKMATVTEGLSLPPGMKLPF
mgnify:CR=1 FL=1